MLHAKFPSSVPVLALLSAGLLGACRAPDAVGPTSADPSLIAPANAAFAEHMGKPDRVVNDFSRGPIPIFHCGGFDAIATFSGTIASTIFYDANGTPVSVTNQYNTSSVIYNSVTGRTIFGMSHGPDHVEIAPDGAELVASSGLLIDFVDENGQHLAFSAGLIVQRFNADGTVDTLFTAGQPDAYLANRRSQICGLLAG